MLQNMSKLDTSGYGKWEKTKAKDAAKKRRNRNLINFFVIDFSL